MKFSVKDFFSKFNQIHKKMYILSHLLKIENFIFVCNGLNSLSLLIYFQYQHYFIYGVDDVRITKKIYFNLNSNHNVANVDTIEIERKISFQNFGSYLRCKVTYFPFHVIVLM